MSTEVTFKIESDSDIKNTQLVSNIRAYAEKVLGWTEKIPDPDFVQSEDPEEQVEVPLIPNPVSFLRAVYGDFPTTKVKQWVAEREGEQAKSEMIIATKESLESVSVQVVE